MTYRPSVYIFSRSITYAISYSRMSYDIGCLLHDNGYNVRHFGFVSGSVPGITYNYVPFAAYAIPESFKVPPVQQPGKEAKDMLLEKLKDEHVPAPDVVFIVEDIICGNMITRLKKIWPNSKYVIYTMFDGEHLVDNLYLGPTTRSIYLDYSQANLVLSPTNFSNNEFKKRNIDAVLLPLWFNEKVFSPSKMINPANFTVQSVARNTYRKNLGNILRAIPLIPKDVKFRFRTEIETHDPTSISFPGIVTSLDIADRIEFERFDPFYVSNEDTLVYAYNDASLGIYPSMREGWCIPALEMMACGNPVIVTANTAMDDWVPKEMPRFRPDSSFISGGFSSIEQVVSPGEIAGQILTMYNLYANKIECQLFNRDYVRSLVENFTMTKFEKRLVENMNIVMNMQQPSN